MLVLLDTLGVKAAVLGDAGNAILDSAEKWNLGLLERFREYIWETSIWNIGRGRWSVLWDLDSKAEGCSGAYQ